MNDLSALKSCNSSVEVVPRPSGAGSQNHQRTKGLESLPLAEVEYQDE